MKKLLVIQGHPRDASFCNALVERYVKGARASGAEVRELSLNTLELEPWLKYDWGKNHDSIPLSEHLRQARELIAWSEHVTFAYPTFWTTPPALVKLFIEAIVASGFAFKYHKPLWGGIPRWDKLLKGRTATIISTMDAPPFYMNWYEGDPGGKMMKNVLRFTGIRLVGKHYFGSVVLSKPEKREVWLRKARVIGTRDGR